MRDKFRQILLPASLLGMLAGMYCVAWINANTNFASFLAGESVRVERTDRVPMMITADDSAPQPDAT